MKSAKRQRQQQAKLARKVQRMVPGGKSRYALKVSRRRYLAAIDLTRQRMDRSTVPWFYRPITPPPSEGERRYRGRAV